MLRNCWGCRPDTCSLSTASLQFYPTHKRTCSGITSRSSVTRTWMLNQKAMSRPKYSFLVDGGSQGLLSLMNRINQTSPQRRIVDTIGDPGRVGVLFIGHQSMIRMSSKKISLFLNLSSSVISLILSTPNPPARTSISPPDLRPVS